VKIFLSHSGSASRLLTSLLRDWLPNVIQAIEHWVSDSDIIRAAAGITTFPSGWSPPSMAFFASPQKISRAHGPRLKPALFQNGSGESNVAPLVLGVFEHELA
jgi:hypothetical protein